MDSLQEGTALSHYRLLAQLGQGGMGQVFLARDEILGRQVAIKLLPPELQSDSEARERLLREARAAALLSHPNVCTIHEIAEHDGRSFIVMQHVEGEALVERIRRGAIPVSEAVAIAVQVARALAAAHARSVIHRDIKPHNIMIGPSGHVTVLDFGLAKLSATDGGEAVSELTRTGMVAGTPPYMSPEQLRGETLDGRTDLFSLGVVLYEMLGGRRPFDGETAAQLIAAILVLQPPPLSALVPAFPATLQGVVEKMLAKERELRHQTAEEVVADLESTLGRGGGSGSDDSRSTTIMLTAKAPRRSRPKKQAIDSVAVLPLADAGAPEEEYLSEGVVEGTINRLSRIPKLRVMARSTVFRYRGSALDPLAIGAELGVRAVLSGRMTRRGDEILISLELVDVADGSHLWGQQYRSRGDDFFELNDRIGEEVSLAVRPKLAASRKSPPEPRYRSTPEAYQLYLKGMFHWNRREPSSMATAIDFFRQANEADPAYAAPYGGLAEAYMYLGFLEVRDPADVFPRARAAAHKALELDPSFSDAHAALGWMTAMNEWDWALAERELRTAIRLNPNSAIAHHWLGLILSYMRKFDAAQPELELAQQLDPLSPIINTILGLTRFHRGDLDGAIRMYRKAFDVSQHFVPLHLYLGAALDAAGRYEESLEQFEAATRLSPQGTIWMSGMGHCLGRMGKTAEARSMLESMLARRRNEYTSAFSIATVVLGLGDDEEAIAWLERAVEERASWLCTLGVDQRWNRLRTNTRFEAVMRALRLP